MSEREIFEKEFVVEPGDIDVLGHVNNLVYLRWVQDIAVAHWMAAADPVDVGSRTAQPDDTYGVRFIAAPGR